MLTLREAFKKRARLRSWAWSLVDNASGHGASRSGAGAPRVIEHGAGGVCREGVRRGLVAVLGINANLKTSRMVNTRPSDATGQAGCGEKELERGRTR